MTMWQELRKNYTKYTQTDIGNMLGITKQAVCQYENGIIRMPDNVQIMYLKFRNNKYDKLIIEYLGGNYE